MNPKNFHLETLDGALVAAFASLQTARAGDLLYNLSLDTLAAKGFPNGARLPNPTELASLRAISGLMDQCVRAGSDHALQNTPTVLDATAPGVTYLNEIFTIKRKVLSNIKPNIVLPGIQQLVRSRPRIAAQALRAAAGAAAALPPNVLERRGGVQFEQQTDPNGTLRIVERDVATNDTREVVAGLTADQMTHVLDQVGAPSNLVVYEAWSEQANAASSTATVPVNPTQSTMPDNLPAPGDTRALDPFMSELMQAMQQRIADQANRQP